MTTPKKRPEDKLKTGPKEKYNSKYHPKMIELMVRNGMTDKEVANELEISERTFNYWKKKYPEILQSLKSKNEADREVENSLFKRAIGYDYEETKIVIEDGKPKKIERIKKHIPASEVAGFFWLKNRQPEKWRDKQQLEHTGKDGGSIEHTIEVILDDDD